MPRNFSFATTSSVEDLVKAASRTCEVLRPDDRAINCYDSKGGVLINYLPPIRGTWHEDPFLEFRESLGSFQINPTTTSYDRFNVFIGQPIGLSHTINDIFMELENLLVMINFPTIILFSRIRGYIEKDRNFDWYAHEEEFGISPDW